MSQALEEAKRLAATCQAVEQGAVAWALIAIAEELQEIKNINHLIYEQTFQGINVFNREG
jgi:hypothetical protein